jgi:hypothetical protein
MSNLGPTRFNEYPLLKEYLGPVLEEPVKRVIHSSDEQNILTAALSDPWAESKNSLRELEEVLRLGKAKCQDFGCIFRRLRNLSITSPYKANEVIHDIIVEVEAFEYLHNHRFTEITRLRESPKCTVDFVAHRSGNTYAIEATRLGIPQSPRKQVKPFLKDTLIKGLSGVNAHDRFVYSLSSKIKAEYAQLDRFCKAQRDGHSGIVIVSVGRRFFISERTRDEFNILPNTAQNALAEVWHKLKMNDSCLYLNHLIFIVRRDRIYAFPDLPG